MRSFAPLVAFVVLPSLGLSACGRPELLGVRTNPEFIAGAQGPTAAEAGGTCLAPEEVRLGKEYTCADGKMRTGTLAGKADGSKDPVVVCTKDGEVACVSTSSFPAAAASGLAAKVLSGQTVAGIAGSALVRPAD